jgi:hypothetical protein
LDQAVHSNTRVDDTWALGGKSGKSDDSGKENKKRTEG